MNDRLTRRRVLSWMATAYSAVLGPVWAEEEKPSDRGIGGTGITAEPVLQPGRIGFIGTIQRFGSIYVNDARITYRKNISVWVDGEPRGASALAVGQVVRTLAHESTGGRLTTDRVDVVSEVIGPIATVTNRTLIVMGQTVRLWGGARPGWWQPGARAAICGVRMADGSIVASLIEPAGSRPDQVVGVPSMQGWNLGIGKLPLLGIGQQFAGWRVIVRGTPVEGGFKVARVHVDAPFVGAKVDRLSVETYVKRNGGSLQSGAGVRVVEAGAASRVDGGRDIRAYMNIDLGAAGDLRVDGFRFAGGTDTHSRAPNLGDDAASTPAGPFGGAVRDQDGAATVPAGSPAGSTRSPSDAATMPAGQSAGPRDGLGGAVGPGGGGPRSGISSPGGNVQTPGSVGGGLGRGLGGSGGLGRQSPGGNPNR